MKYYSNKKVENYHPNKVALQTMDWLTAENAVQLGTSNLQHPSNTSQSFDMLAGHSVEFGKIYWHGIFPFFCNVHLTSLHINSTDNAASCFHEIFLS